MSKNIEFFHGLDDLGAPRRGLLASVGVHVVVLTLLLVIPLMFTDSLKLKYNAILLAPPPPERRPLEVTNYSAPPKPLIRPVLPAIAPNKPLVIPEPPQPREVPKPEVTLPKIPKIETAEMPVLPPKPALATQPAPTPAPPRMEIRTDSFSAVSAAEPAKLQPKQVQTGGFGDPNGASGKPTGKVTNIASLGAFDLPTGAGAGNGTGGAQGARTVVASSGFGSAGAPSGSSGFAAATRDRNLHQSGFGDIQAAPATPIQKKAESAAPDTPAEITSKPKPDYTEEARKLRLEGEVLLRAVFSATGEVRVLEVVRGLGHGLDENAMRAAQQIRFKPALKDGHPVDSTVTVHIIFQLAF